MLRLLICLFLSSSLLSCASQSRQIRLAEPPDIPSGGEVRRLSGPIREVAPPAILSDLAGLLPNQQPRVAIAYPKPDQVIEDTQLEVRLDVQNFSIYKDEKVGLGPHIQLILDNQPAQLVYSLEDTLTLEGLAPGSHTLRAIAVQPWGESFKNEAAYAQTTFHLFGKTNENTPDPELPLLTYIEPQGTFGAEPLLLDFYLTNAPLHFLAQEDAEDELLDWKIRGIVNGKDFVIDQWQPIYLKGFEPGKNWIQLTLIDEQGRLIENEFNSTIRVIDYDSTQRDALAKLIRGELPLQEVGQIVDLDYQPSVEVVTPEQSDPGQSEENELDQLEADQIETENEELEAEYFEEPDTNLDTSEVEFQEPEEAEELEAENLPREKEDTEETGLETFTDEEAEKATVPAIINSEQSRLDETIEETRIEETSPLDARVENLESEAQAEQPQSTEPTLDQTTSDQTNIEQPSQETAVPLPTEGTPKRKSLFERFFGRKQSPPITESITKQSGKEEQTTSSQEVSPSEDSALDSTTLDSTAIEQVPSQQAPLKLDTSSKTNDSAVLRSAEATQEPIEDDAVSEEITDTVELPTELSAPSTPTDNLLVPKSAEPVIDVPGIDKFDIINPVDLESKTLEENINSKLKADDEVTIGE
ncbi:hypothetical protein [Synechococcus sp. PCC 7335]|uniref:hypothetical protein n=1 Tax=Synechococcus sp. (strain ATCC 29403 / PCC 7335) TaxID=91464 RepID=UPI0012F71679|nr:hypothetical protein [Synechococcus sp. PCC 7335]